MKPCNRSRLCYFPPPCKRVAAVCRMPPKQLSKFLPGSSARSGFSCSLATELRRRVQLVRVGAIIMLILPFLAFRAQAGRLLEEFPVWISLWKSPLHLPRRLWRLLKPVRPPSAPNCTLGGRCRLHLSLVDPIEHATLLLSEGPKQVFPRAFKTVVKSTLRWPARC